MAQYAVSYSAGGTFPQALWSRWVFHQWTHSDVASSTCSTVRHGPPPGVMPVAVSVAVTETRAGTEQALGCTERRHRAEAHDTEAEQVPFGASPG